mgnify:CR=1 FL=1
MAKNIQIHWGKIFFILQDKLRAAGIDHSPSETGWAAQEGWFTTAWAMYKENLDYLRCPDKLEWNGKSTCK